MIFFTSYRAKIAAQLQVLTANTHRLVKQEAVITAQAKKIAEQAVLIELHIEKQYDFYAECQTHEHIVQQYAAHHRALHELLRTIQGNLKLVVNGPALYTLVSDANAELMSGALQMCKEFVPRKPLWRSK